MNSETKRPGEDPEFDERANEDGYFASKEHELIEAMRLEFKKPKRRGVRRSWRPARNVRESSKSTRFWVYRRAL